MMQIVELSPSGTSTDEKPAPKISESGSHIIREPKELFTNWLTGGQMPLVIPIDDSEAVSDIEQAPTIENHIFFAIIRDPRIQIVHPIPVEIRHDGDAVIAFWNEAEEYGHGRDRSEALEDFGRSVSQLFVSLSRDESQLGDDLRHILTLLRKHLRFRVAR